MKVLVTGAAGFVGSNLTDRLLELGHDVLVVDEVVRAADREVVVVSTVDGEVVRPSALSVHREGRAVAVDVANAR